MQRVNWILRVSGWSNSAGTVAAGVVEHGGEVLLGPKAGDAHVPARNVPVSSITDSITCPRTIEAVVREEREGGHTEDVPLVVVIANHGPSPGALCAIPPYKDMNTSKHT